MAADLLSHSATSPHGEAVARWEREHFFSHLVWLFPLAYCVHIAEEAKGFSSWVAEILGGDMSSASFYRNNAGFMLLLLALTAWASRTRSSTATRALFFWVSGQQFWNALFHVYTEHQFAAYSPGYFSAILVYLPLYSYLTYLALRERFLSWRFWLVCLVAGAVGMAITVWAGLYHFGPVPIDRWL